MGLVGSLVSAGVVAGSVVLDSGARCRSGRFGSREGDEVKLLIYGYMRIDPEVPGNDIRQMERVLEYYAEAAGYCFATVFHEDNVSSSSHLSAFDELIVELQRSEARHVIAPSTDHFSLYPLMRTRMLLRLAKEAHAQVYTLSGR